MYQPDREWIQDNLSSLTAHSDSLREIADTTDEPEFGEWTALKHIVLTATVEVYTKIISNNDFDFYYVDAMAGSGITELENVDDALIGSPIIAGTVAKEPFSKMYLIERNEERAEALRERLEFAVDEIDAFTQSRDEYEVIDGDANDVLPEIPEIIKDRRDGSLRGTDQEGGAHHLAFIDNERIEVNFDAIRKLSKMWGDLLINYQEKGINREIGLIENGDDEDWDEILDFFDQDERVKQMESPEERFEFYLEKLDQINRGVSESVTINGSESHPYGYKMIYATKLTGGGSEFAEYMEYQRRKVGNLTGDDIETVLRTMQGDATHLGLWSAEDDDNQSKLGEY